MFLLILRYVTIGPHKRWHTRDLVIVIIHPRKWVVVRGRRGGPGKKVMTAAAGPSHSPVPYPTRAVGAVDQDKDNLGTELRNEDRIFL